MQALMKNNLARFSKEMIEGYDPAVRKLCLKAFDEVPRGIWPQALSHGVHDMKR